MKRARPYIVEHPAGTHEMPAHEWKRYLGLGLLRQVRERVARPAKNVIAWLEEGRLRLLHAYWIYTSWIAVDRAAPVRQIDQEEFEQLHCGLKILRYSVITQVKLSGIPSNS